MTKPASTGGLRDYLVVRGLASTFGRDRVGDTVTRAALERAVEKYRANPIVLYDHKYNRPAGVVTSARVDDAGLWIEAKLPKPSDPENLTWWRLVRARILRALSIGGTWTRDAARRLVEIDLREVSIAAVGVNADTLLSTQIRKAFGDAPSDLGSVRHDLALVRARLAGERLTLALAGR